MEEDKVIMCIFLSGGSVILVKPDSICNAIPYNKYGVGSASLNRETDRYYGIMRGS